MKLEVGIYVRTKWGYICKITNINDFREPTMKYGVEASYLKDVMFIGDDDISKTSHNIIKLIEVGDYVNGHKIVDTNSKNGDKVFYFDGEYYSDILVYFEEKDIKSIVTKEQFSSIEYKVGE